MKKLIILRGPSGTGKSTIARHLHDSSRKWVGLVEADMYFVLDGEYKFDPSKLGQAHNWCQEQVKMSMECNDSDICVSNTSISRWELKPYLALAERFGYTVEVIRTPGPWDRETSLSRNEHGVPAATIDRQLSKYQEYEGETEWTDMSIFDR